MLPEPVCRSMSPDDGLLDLNIAAAGAASHGARDLPRPNVARSGLQANLAGQVRQLHIARSGLRVDVAVRAFNYLISRAAAGADGGIGGHTDLVIDRDVAQVHIIDVNAVAILADRRMLLDLVDVGVAVAHQPVVADIDLSADHHRSRWTRRAP